jgi:hypothetical protein
MIVAVRQKLEFLIRSEDRQERQEDKGERQTDRQTKWDPKRHCLDAGLPGLSPGFPRDRVLGHCLSSFPHALNPTPPISESDL